MNINIYRTMNTHLMATACERRHAQ